MRKVLLIEDNPELRENIAEILSLANYQVYTASSGKDGIEMALAHVPDLILCDIMMPELDGYTVLYMVQQNPELASVPFVFLTAKAEGADLRKGMSLGADDYIIKPFDTNDLLATIERRMKKAELVRQRLSRGIEGVNELISIAGGDKALAHFLEGRHVDLYKKKERIFSEGNHPARLHYVKQGKVKVYKTNDAGKELIVRIAKEGEFFGYTALLKNEPYKATAEALEKAEIISVPRSEFEELMNTNAQVTRKFIALLAADVAEKEEQLIRLAYSSLRRKVADSLLAISEKSTKDGDGAITISRENLAAMAGTATESLIRTLTDFKAEKLIDIVNGKILILRPEKLQKMMN